MTITEFTIVAGVCIFLITAIVGILFLKPGSGMGEGGTTGGRELRKLGRFSNSDLVILSWQERDHSMRTLKCRLTDISEYSAGVRAKRSWELGAQVGIRIPALRLAGAAHVRRCATVRSKFDLGLEFRGPLYRD